MRTMKTTTKKRRLALFVAVIMALSLWTALPLQASADEANTANGVLTYTVSGGNATITKYVGTDTDLTISSLGGNPVTAIAANAFDKNNTLVSVTIPTTVTSINASAFLGATVLATITVTAGNPTYSSVDGVLFAQDAGETILVRYPAGKSSTYTIPSNVTAIGRNAFGRHKTLTTINIPAGVTSIDRNPFSGCTSLTAITVTAGNPNYSSTDGVLFKNNSTLAVYPSGKSNTSYTIPNNVTTISYGAFEGSELLQTVDLNNVETMDLAVFSNCVSLRSITIPDTITSIEESTFYNCRSLTDATIPESVETIGRGAFQECTALTEISFEGVTSLGNAAFYNCTSLEEVTIPGGVENISPNMFDGCTSLAKVTMEEGVETIGADAFLRCVSLAEVSIPGSMTTIDTVFRARSALRTVTMAAPAGNDVRTIAANAFAVCSSLESVSILGNVELGDMAFNGCTSLTDVSIPGLTSVGTYTFVGCAALETFEISATLTSLGAGMFYGCTSLNEITIPANIATIGDSAFWECTSLKSITIPSTVTAIGDSSFRLCTSLDTVVIPGGSATITPEAFNLCSSNLTIWCNNSSTAYTYATTQAIPHRQVGLLLTGITIDGSLSLNVGASQALSAPNYLPADEKTETPAVTWRSSDTTKATVDATGKVTAVAQGTTNITAEATSLSGETITSAACAVTVLPAPSGSITSFMLTDGEDVFVGDIASGNSIAVEVPYGTDVTGLIPTIEVSEGTVSPASGTPTNFTSPVVFTTNSTMYTVTVTCAPATKDITSFTLEGVAGTITDTDASVGTITVTLPAGTEVTNLEPVIEHDGASIDKTGTQDFSVPVTYTVTGADTFTKAYTVTVTVPLSSAKEITSFTLADEDGVIDGNIITVTLPYNTSVGGLTPIIDHTSVKSVDPVVSNGGSFSSNNMKYTVTAEDGTTRVYTVIVKFTSPSTGQEITSFKIGSAVGIINGTDISVTLPTGTSVTALEPEIEISENATVSPDTGEAQNFTSPVMYTVTAQSGARQNYTVTVTVTSPPAPPAPTTYAVTVTNGSGSASYEEGATVTITANAPATGKVFDKWTTSDVTLTDATSATTTFTMPANAVTVTATYKDDPNTGGGGDDPDPPATDDGWVQNEDGEWEYLVDGEAKTGWVYDENTWYYTNTEGIMQTGWEYVGSSWYYLAGNGEMKTGWVKDKNTWYYLTGSGAMKTGWQKDNGSWYYLGGNGAMVAAKWLKDTGGSWYYLSGSGKMLTGKQTIGSKTYTFKANGVWIS